MKYHECLRGSTFEHIRLVGRGFEAERGRVSRQRRRCPKGGEEMEERLGVSRSPDWTGRGTKKPIERGTNATEPETAAAFSLPLHMWMYQKPMHSLYRPARRQAVLWNMETQRIIGSVWFSCISVFHVPFMLFLHNEAVPAYLSECSLGRNLHIKKPCSELVVRRRFNRLESAMFPKMRCLKCKAKEIVKESFA